MTSPAAPAINHGNPPPPGEIDFAVAQSGGTSTAIEATRRRMQSAKNMPILSLPDTVAQLTRENGRLRAELAHAQEKCAALSRLAESVAGILAHLEQSVLGVQGLGGVGE